MIIDILPETEQLVREVIRGGHFQSVDDWIISGVRAWKKRNPCVTAALVGLKLNLEWDRDPVG